MTPDERAEKITDYFTFRSVESEERGREIAFVAAEIRAAVEEEHRFGEIAIELARRQAYEDAARIAEAHESERCEIHFCGKFIVRAIRARAKEVQKKEIKNDTRSATTGRGTEG